ncbi:hypothetical protein SAMN05192561_101394 [Halopenitus malekzadehii]|uniref:PD-(D/E)XK nuclease superfamily protein n=1 Tax=Halopenitus malekzadehii TaxID=1267564 RepID=A0A1H6HWV3_9EURY|nr:hypothetical protein [Halopenitus malekzadehii]SEH38614.1 hypothetical protein SAMN05192561_101394 [Halopenitus malekzadehii]
MGYPFAAPNGYEERLNRQFAGYLAYSLRIGPELLNRVHEDQPFSIAEGARVVGTQDVPLPRYTDDGPDREIDWVVRDPDRLIGYESKYGDSLGTTQLRDELAKLELNADGRDVVLVAVTPHTTPPSAVERIDDDRVFWVGWNTVARTLIRTDVDDLTPEQRPICEMLQDLFEAEGMHPFTGFDHADKLQYRYFIRDLRQELTDTDLEQPGKIHTSTTTDPEPTSWKRLVPKRLDVPFVRSSREDDWKRQRSYLTVTVDTETHDVHVGVVFNVREVEVHREYVADRLDDLLAYAADRDLELWASMNSFNQWTDGIARTDRPAEMRQWLETGARTVVRADETEYKKAIVVHECSGSTPSEIVAEAAAELRTFHEDFLVDDALYPRSTLSGRD